MNFHETSVVHSSEAHTKNKCSFCDRIHMKSNVCCCYIQYSLILLKPRFESWLCQVDFSVLGKGSLHAFPHPTHAKNEYPAICNIWHRGKLPFEILNNATKIATKVEKFATFCQKNWEWLYKCKVLLSNVFHFVEWALFKDIGSV